MHTKIIAVLILILCNSIGNAQDSVYIGSLKDAVSLALKRNVDVLNSTVDINSKRSHYVETVSDVLPQIKAGGKGIDNFISPTTVVPAEYFGGAPGSVRALKMGMPYNINAVIQAKQTIFDQAAFISIRSSKSAVELSHTTLEKTKEDIAVQVAYDYFNILLCSKQRDFLKKQLESQRRLLSIAQTQFNTGVLKKNDLSRIRVNLINTQTELQQFENQIEQQTSDLALLLALAPGQTVVITDSISESPLFSGGPEKFAVSDRPDWRILDLQIQLKKLDIKYGKAGYLPALSLTGAINQDFYGADFKRFDSDWYTSSFMAVTLDIPLFDGLKRKAQIDQAHFELEKLNNRQSFLNEKSEKEIHDAQSNLAYSVSRMNSQKSNLELGSEVYGETAAEYKAGSASLSDLMNAENALLQSERQYLSAIEEKVLAEISLRKAQGVLLKKIGVD